MLKNLLFCLFVGIGISVNAQSDKKVSRETFQTVLSVATAIPSPTNDEISIISCEYGSFNFFLGKRRLVLSGGLTSFDLRAINRNVGDYHSWIAIERITDSYFLVSPFFINDKASIMIQPITPEGVVLNGTFYVISAAKELCK